MKVTVVHPSELGPNHHQKWESFQRESSLGSPFLSWEFTQVIGQVRDDARVAVVDDGSSPAAFLAFQTDPDRIGRPIGATIGDAQAVMCESGWPFDPQELVAAAGLACWHFDHLVAAQRPFAPFHRGRHRSPIVDLRNGHDRFLEDVRAHSKDLLAQVGRRRRKLEREVGPVVCEWQSTQPDQDLDCLQRWKSEQYARDGTWDRFAEAWIARSVRQLSRSRQPGCTGVLTVLRAGDHPVAAHFGLVGHDRMSWWFPAYDPDFGRYSPGLILLLALIKEAAERQVPVLDLGRGEHEYKLRVTPRYFEVADGEVDAVPA